jgi:inner membrane protein
LIGAPVIFTSVGFLPWFSLTALLIAAAILAWLQRRAGEKGITALVCGAVIAFCFVAMQSFASGIAKRRVHETLARQNPPNRFLDSAMTSYPTNPLCWNFVTVEMNEANHAYYMKRGLMSLAPDFLPVAKCPVLLSEPGKQKEVAKGITISDEFIGDLTQLRELSKKNCYFNAWMRFARVPQVTATEATDMRFQARGDRRDFTSLDLSKTKEECPWVVPQWRMPREDLL